LVTVAGADVTVGVVAAASGAAGGELTASAASAGATSMVVAINATANFRIMRIVLLRGFDDRPNADPDATMQCPR
jgi:hypothetical protein